MMSAKLAPHGLLKIKILKNKDYNIIIVDYEISNKALSCYSNYRVDVVMLPKFVHSSLSMAGVIITSIL